MRVAEMGDSSPLLLLAHGWPESWYSWRHQIVSLANAGYRVVALDMPSFCESQAPADVDDYDVIHTSADLLGILDALEEETAVLVGHDWGAIVAWQTVLMHPTRFTTLINMSVPYSGRAAQSPMKRMRQSAGHWVQQEAPLATTAAMLEFLNGLRKLTIACLLSDFSLYKSV